MRRVNNPNRTSVYMRKIEIVQEFCLTPPTNELTTLQEENQKVKNDMKFLELNNHKTPNAKKCATKINKRK